MSALGSVNFFFPGIVFLYQGQAAGMLDYRKKSIDEFRDPTTFNMYRGYLQEGMTEEQALEKLNVESREHARTPMQWNAQENAGFTDGTPWFAVNPNYKEINLEAEKGKEESLYHWYRKMIALRKSDEYSGKFSVIARPVSRNTPTSRRKATRACSRVSCTAYAPKNSPMISTHGAR